QSATPGGAVRPVLYAYKMAMPGDAEVAKLQLMVFGVTQKKRVTLGFPEQDVTFMTPFFFKFVGWDKKSQYVSLLQADRWFKSIKFSVADAETGAAHDVVEEHGKTHMDPNLSLDIRPNARWLGNNDEVLWFSEQDGWAHLYLYDGKSGALKKQVTSGSWVVCDIAYVDEGNRWVYFRASGKESGEDPYLQHLYRVKLDGSGLQLLTPEPAHHEVQFSPAGRYFTDTYSRADQPAITVLRSADGKLLRELERADASGLTSKGWNPPEVFRARAADGTTEIYGMIVKPTNFDAN